LPPPGTSWRFSKERFAELIKDNHIYFGQNGDNVPRYKRFLYEVQDGFVPLTIWPRDEVGDNQEAKKEVKKFNPEVVFPTPKPERLLERVIQLSTKEGDLVLDSFLGSGTTAAVAQKMNRKWIGIEMTDVVYTHDKPRLDMVISGKDKGGITKSVGYEGGGGYHFYELAPTLVVDDVFGEPIINKEYSPEMLASAVALHEGFVYSPVKDHFWMQCHSSENSYLFVTTMHINSAIIDKIENDMTTDQFLIIACKTFDEECSRQYKNIVIKKIPEMLLGKCEYGKDDYSLNIINPPVYDDEDDDNEN
jgi:adenine-specific DNA-methyltransferase